MYATKQLTLFAFKFLRNLRRNHVFLEVPMLKVDIAHRHVADAPLRVVERRDVAAIVHVVQPVERAVFCSSR